MVGFAGVASIHRGDITISFLADGGAVTEPTVSFPASDPQGWERHPEYLDDDGKLVTSIGGFLIQTGDRTIVVDTGLGPTRLDIPGVGFFQGGEFLHSLAELDVNPRDVTDVVFTHLHSDHTLGLPDIMLGNWVLDRPFPIDLYGPPGTRNMAELIVAAWQVDLEVRTGGLEPHSQPDYEAVVREIEAGVVYSDDSVQIEAFAVPHASWKHAFGYKFTSAGRTIVISGDARPSDAIVEACSGCDILIHEVYSAAMWQRREPVWQAYHANAHTSTIELAELARRAQPKLLVLYHQLYWGTDDAGLLREIREAGYTGEVVSASDLDIF
jgi:ribonuclease BN (tRNA processing enzyme)